ncbi:MAG: SMP-30/gluconolactonase/LRE family protein [Xanthomonadales bacterium]
MRLLFALLALPVLAAPPLPAAADSAPYPVVGQVQRLAPALDELLSADARVERLTEDRFTWSEGPVWVPDGAFLLFSDVPEDTMWRWSESGGLDVFLQPSALVDGRQRDPSGEGSNGLLLAPDGTLLVADHGSRALITVDLDSRTKTLLAGHYDGKRFNSPNDLALSRVRWPGVVFFTDPPYGLQGQDDSPRKELAFNGIYRLDTDGAVALLDTSLARPNGIVLSPDERFLYVANSQAERSEWVVFELDAAGGVAAGPRLFFSAQARADRGDIGLPDGMAMDVHGNLFATGPGGVLVLDPAGRLLGVIETGTAVANCAFGGADGSVLYLTSHRFLARVQTRTRGIEFRP